VGLASFKRKTALVAHDHHAVQHPAGRETRGHSKENRLAYLSPYVFKLGQIPRRRREGRAGAVRHASFGTTMDGYTQAFEAPKREAQEQLADLIMRTGTVGHA
jgi:hypothetical protein